ncbi:MAG: hypothetical protein RI988_928 [Pseudomonadota bacterium]|jgi:hypothetical protein
MVDPCRRGVRSLDVRGTGVGHQPREETARARGPGSSACQGLGQVGREGSASAATGEALVQRAGACDQQGAAQARYRYPPKPMEASKRPTCSLARAMLPRISAVPRTVNTAYRTPAPNAPDHSGCGCNRPPRTWTRPATIARAIHLGLRATSRQASNWLSKPWSAARWRGEGRMSSILRPNTRLLQLPRAGSSRRRPAATNPHGASRPSASRCRVPGRWC